MMGLGFGVQPDSSGELAVIDQCPSTNSYWFSMLALTNNQEVRARCHHKVAWDRRLVRRAYHDELIDERCCCHQAGPVLRFGWPRDLRGVCVRQWDSVSPSGSPDPSASRIRNCWSCSAEIPPGGLSVSGDNAERTPLRHRPHILCGQAVPGLSFPCSLADASRIDNVCLNHLENSKTTNSNRSSRGSGK